MSRILGSEGFVLGLDVSTSTVGVCVLDPSGAVVAGNGVLRLEAVQFKKERTLWEKADTVASYLAGLKATSDGDVGRIVVEEALLGFRPGMSSATTISALLRFNGIVSYVARNAFGVEPEYVASNHARKVCGIRLVRTAIGGPQKEQVFSHMAANDLKGVAWPLTRAGKVVPWSRDATDAYVVARAAALNRP